MQEFLNYIHSALKNGDLFKITLSKARKKSDQLKNVFIRPITLGTELAWHATIRYQTNDKTQNFTKEDLVNAVSTFLESSFFNADLFLVDKKITILQSKKGNSKVLVSKGHNKIELTTHDQKKKRIVPEDAPYLISLGISSSNGKVYGHAQDKYRQINKFVELLANLTKGDSSVSNIHDMGCGKGYLTFALHDYLNQSLSQEIQTVGVEIREDLVKKCNRIADNHQMNNLSFMLGSIDDFPIERSDVVIALHACDIATDMAIAKGIEANAKYIVVAPCCHKQIRKSMQSTDSVLNPLLQHGILKERQAEMITDTIRALLLESIGYEVKVFEFISSEHTGKNVMLTAKKTNSPNASALSQIENIKKEFGISYHYLETLIENH